MNALVRGGLSLTLVVGTAVSLGCSSAASGSSEVPMVATGAIWTPKPEVSWQWQLSGKVDTSVRAKVFDIDGEGSSPTLVKKLHRKGARVICYISAGSWEDWRKDAGAFPDSVRGSDLDGWPGEKWLDIRRLDVLLPIIEKRIAACSAKGFDGVEPDNVDGYTNSAGFPITASDQLAYNKAIAKLAHRHGLAVGLKTTPTRSAPWCVTSTSRSSRSA